MKALHLLLKHGEDGHEDLRLFTKLREIKKKQEPIAGIPLVHSDCSEDEDQIQAIERIKQRLAQFKQSKAREVAAQHHKTKEPIESIVFKLKDDLQYQALCIINPSIQDSVERKIKPAKEMGSTLPGTIEKSNDIQTPGFDLPSSKSKNSQAIIDLREFTLGQREQGSSCRSQKCYAEHDSVVSEFHIPSRQPSSRRIKDKIMNSNKNRNK